MALERRKAQVRLGDEAFLDGHFDGIAVESESGFIMLAGSRGSARTTDRRRDGPTPPQRDRRGAYYNPANPPSGR